MEVLDPEHSGMNLFDENWTIYSRNPGLPAHMAGKKSCIDNSLITNGCKINGTVKHSVLSAGVVVEEGAVVLDAVIMSGTVIKSGAVVQRCIIADNCVVEENAAVGAAEGEIAHTAAGVTIGRSATVKAGAKVYDDVKEGEEVC